MPIIIFLDRRDNPKCERHSQIILQHEYRDKHFPLGNNKRNVAHKQHFGEEKVGFLTTKYNQSKEWRKAWIKKLVPSGGKKSIHPWKPMKKPMSMGFPRQECWSGLPFPSPEDLFFFFSRGSYQSRDWTRVSHIAGRFFIIWATRETHITEIYGI